MWMILFVLALPAIALGQTVTTLKPFNLTATLMFLDTDLDVNGKLEKSELDENFKKYDTDGNGRVSRLEYITYVDAHTPTLHDLHDNMFNFYDVDKDHILQKHDYDSFYALMDGDSDGVVTHFEFVNYWTVLLEILEQYLHGKTVTA